MTSNFDEAAVTAAARHAALEVVVVALVKTHPDKAALGALLSTLSQAQFEIFSASVPDRMARGQEFAQQNFDKVLSAFVLLTKSD
jgi:hypothetical protein